MKIKGAIFDMDGVIIDSEYHNLLMQQEVMAKDGVHVDIETLYPLVGLEWDLHFDYVLSFYNKKKTDRKISFSLLLYLIPNLLRTFLWTT